MAFFDVSEVWKHILLAQGAETPELVAPEPNIDDFTAFLVHFRPFSAQK